MRDGVCAARLCVQDAARGAEDIFKSSAPLAAFRAI